MRSEKEREGIIEDIMGSSMEAGEFLDQLDAANEQIERYEKMVKKFRFLKNGFHGNRKELHEKIEEILNETK